MPARIVRGEINASESLSRVSMLADLTFRALIVACDDWGRIDGRLPVLRGLIFPLRPEVTDRKLDGWLNELAAGPDAPIIRYVVDGRAYIALSGWEKHRGKSNRAASSKCPEPGSGRSAEIPGDPPVCIGYGVEGNESTPESGGPPSASKPGRSARRRVDPRAEAAWPLIRAAFAEHAAELGPNLGIDRSDLIAKRIDDGATVDDLVAAVHGYVRQNGLEPRGDFDPRRFFRPQTVFKAEGFSDRVDAGRGPRPVGSGVSKAAQLWGLR